MRKDIISYICRDMQYKRAGLGSNEGTLDKNKKHGIKPSKTLTVMVQYAPQYTLLGCVAVFCAIYIRIR